MRRFKGVSGLVGACLFVVLGGCTVYVVPAEEADSGAEDEPTATGVAVSDGTEASDEEAEERPDESSGTPMAVAGAERRRDTTSAGIGIEAPSPDQRRGARRRDRRRARSGSRQLHVPPGHHPPLGQCRIWYEDLPPGRQPVPEPCDRLLADRYPAGAFILYGGESWDGDHDWETVAVDFPGAVPRPVIALSGRIGGEAESVPTGAVAVGRGAGGAAGRPDSRAPGASDREAPGGAADSGASARAGETAPRQVRVPSRHRPPEGRCRVWYEGRPVGRQEPSRPCEDLVDRELEADAFILYGDRSFEVGHDWAEAEAEAPGTLPGPLLDVLIESSEEEPAATLRGATPAVDLPDADSRRPGEPRR